MISFVRFIHAALIEFCDFTAHRVSQQTYKQGTSAL